MSQRAYGEQEGLSSSMVSYYLKKARQQSVEEEGFAELGVTTSVHHERVVRIRYTNGTLVEIPL